MEKISVNITIRKDGRYMGKFIVGYDDKGKAQYQNVYGKTYAEAESKVLIGQEVASRYLTNKCITVGKIVISAPKSASSFRDIAIPDSLMEYFRMFRDEADHYILSGFDKPVEPRTMQYRYKKILRSAEIGNHNYHKLRHTFATNCAEHGFDVKTLSTVLGHSSVSLTLNRYVHPDVVYQRRMINSMCRQL